MLRPSTARDASTCLRCHLRLVLRQLQQRRHQSSEHSPADKAPPHTEEQSRLRIVRDDGSHGRIRGKKGGQRRLESAEPLTIKSLGQSSEVIVLRDLHEPKKRQKVYQEEVQFDDEGVEIRKYPSVTAREIETLSNKRGPLSSGAEVFESIESLKPEEGDYVLSRSAFNAKVNILVKSYSMTQVREYLYQKVASVAARKRQKPKPEKIQPTEISSAQGQLQQLEASPWHPGISDITKRLSMTRLGIDRQLELGRRLNKKDFVAEKILRDAWGLMIEEEEADVGEMEFCLTPMQFGLLLTKNSNSLRPLLETTKFYKNSRFQMYRPENVIRIIGPRAEAEAMAAALADAYRPARSVDMDLATFSTLLQEDASEVDLEDIFGPEQLQQIMDLTKTYIRYDSEAGRLQVASFADVPINDAHRLLMALLPVPTRNRTQVLFDKEARKCRLETIPTEKITAFRAQFQHLGRWVAAVPKTPARSVYVEPEEPVDTSAIESQDKDSSSPATNQKTCLTRDSNVIKNTIRSLRTEQRDMKGKNHSGKTYWHTQPWQGFWKARVGHILHEPLGKPFREIPKYSLSVNQSRSKDVFAPRLPGLLNLLKGAKMFYGDKKMLWEGKNELVAHLIPSPLEKPGVLAATTFPRVQLSFIIQDTTLRKDDSPSRAPKGRKQQISTDLGNGKIAIFKDMRAIVDYEVVEVNMPSQPIDLRFERKQTVGARMSQLDSHVTSFVKAIHESMRNDAALRAPPALQLQVPQWACQFDTLESLPKDMHAAATKLKNAVENAGKEVAVKYLFAGFEHREKRDLELENRSSTYRARFETIEGGVTGGRRMELSLIKKPQANADAEVAETESDIEDLIDASLDVIKNMKDVQPGKEFLNSPIRAQRILGPMGTTTDELFANSKLERGGSDAFFRINPATAVEGAPESIEGQAQDAEVLEQSDQIRGLADSPLDLALDDDLPEKQLLDAAEHSEIDKVAQQEQGANMDTDEDLRAQEITSDEKSLNELEPEEVKQAVDQAVEQAVENTEDESETRVENEPTEGLEVNVREEVDGVAKENIEAASGATIELPASGSTSAPSEDTTEVPTSETTSTSSETTTPSPTSPPSSTETPESNTANSPQQQQPSTPAEEEEPLSIRLRRMMGGGR